MVRATILAISVVISLLFISDFVASGTPGGRTKVSDAQTNKEIQALGRYSVEEYNRSKGNHKGGAGDLKFVKVVEAEKQVVAGIKYYLKIVAFPKSGISKVFDAEVVVKPGGKSKQLINFKPSTPKK